MSGYIDQQIGQYGDIVRKSTGTAGAERGGQTGQAANELSSAQSSNIENKTQTLPYTLIQGPEQNVLNGYRSYTYNFTIAVLSLTEANDPASYRDNPLTRVILKSGGKGPDAIANDSTLTEGFNKDSPGRFDMFIDNIEIDSLMAFTESSSVSLPTSISFEVIEPYSITGFIEALQVAAVSAGYPNYVSASFVLKMDFQGYPDSSSIEDATAKFIPNSSRYYMFRFTGVSVDINEQGTRYRCTAVPWTQAGFGEPNKLKKPIQIKGTTVKEILNNFMDGLNKQIEDASKESKESDKTIHDEYAIVFPSVSPTGFDTTRDSKVFDVNMSDFKENRSIEFVDPSSSTSKDAYNGPLIAARDFKPPEQTKLDASGKTTAQFRDGAAIHECIASVIRDSKFGSDIIENLSKTIDEYGFFNYFMVNIEVTNLLKFDWLTRKPAQKYTYVITPYRMHYTNVPGYADQNIDVTQLKKYVSLREYNYLYKGKNIDVLTFKINFNTLYFEAMPYAMGNNDKPRAANTAAPDGGSKPSKAAPGGNAKRGGSGTNAVAPSTTIAEAGDMPAGGAGTAPQTDPYTVMSRNMHNAIINSSVGMVTGEIEIIGDPFFLVTGGTGNYNPKLENIGKTVNGESAYNYGEVYVTINFRNPIDISTFENGGQVYFSKENAQFSGVYKVIKAQSRFKHGLFTQRLELIRLPGQISDNTPKSDANTAIITIPDFKEALVVDTSKSTDWQGFRATFNSPGVLTSDMLSGFKVPAGFDLASTLGRALPGVGNFTAAAGGLGGNLLNSVSGAVTSGIGAVTAGAAIFGGSIPGGVDQLASGIRLNAAGLLSSTSGIRAKVDALTAGTSLDPTAMASKLGINTSQISGLGTSLKSKMLDQLGSFAKDLPANVDLGTARLQGLALDLIPGGKIGNIPALARFATAPIPELPKLDNITALAAIASIPGLPGNISAEINSVAASSLAEINSVAASSLAEINSVAASSLAKFNPLAGFRTPSVTSPLSTLYSLTSEKK